jgi:parafibromin
MAAVEQDPLLLMRQAIASEKPAVPTASADPAAPETSLPKATHLKFTHPNKTSVPLNTPTRFVSNENPVDLRSIYFAWLNREVAIPEYNASATQLNDALSSGPETLGRVQNLAFVERLDLITWLEGASEESEYIKPLAADKDATAANAASQGAHKGSAAPATALSRSGRGALDPRLAVIYNGERKTGDRNTALRGTKPTVSSSISPCPPLSMQLMKLMLAGFLPCQEISCWFHPEEGSASQQ